MEVSPGTEPSHQTGVGMEIPVVRHPQGIESVLYRTFKKYNAIFGPHQQAEIYAFEHPQFPRNGSKGDKYCGNPYQYE